ncbi:MAG TPA: hypothetical protein PK725_08345 [Rhodocyclaceae bacterium]|jgi:hypothetical protein|nr:hypothetical protein [Rhodocyclaceae bacterium]HRQ46948.1 hypothetical protein [Rhodocyclaceae bacterium]
MHARETLIDAEHAAFITGAVSIGVAGRNRERLPSLTRGVGCRVAADRSRVYVLVGAEQSREVLADIRDNGMIAVVFSQPSTHRTVQFKADDACVEALDDADLLIVERYRQAFVAHLSALGYSELAVRTLIDCPAYDLVAIGFSPCAAFTQTPGPQAGMPLSRVVP